jgi:hypothetical protein
MIRPSKTKFLVALAVAGLVLRTDAARACAACYGKADGPLADGMNWGIMSLLVLIVLVLGGFASFFIYLARRAAAFASTLPVAQPPVLASTQKA